MQTLITGAGRGIGRALADRLAADGHSVVGTCRGAVARPVGWLSMDVRDPSSVRAAAAAFGKGALDLLVCNAGVLLERGETLEKGYPDTLWAETFAANVTGVFLTVQAFLPNLRRAVGARIAIISSDMGSDARAPGGSYAYRASKAAVLNLGRNLATDLRPEGISVGIYHPGWVSTDMGGRAAPVTPEESARGLAQRFSELTPDTTGCFVSYDGRGLQF
ncbi:MAG: 3-oxoacyl-[acyl-carrier-protein] reductase FabG [Pseudomonadota bacterium]